MRAFLAVTLGEAAKTRISDLQRTLRDAIEREAKDSRISWVRAETMHLTIAFFAAIDASQAARLHEALAATLPTFRPADLPLTRVGAFPSLREPRTIWAGPAESWSQSADGLAVRDLGTTVRTACVALAIEHDDKPLRPHLTLGRVRSQERQVGRVLSGAAFNRDFDAGRITIQAVTLMESELAAGGPRHTERWTIRLAGAS